MIFKDWLGINSEFSCFKTVIPDFKEDNSYKKILLTMKFALWFSQQKGYQKIQINCCNLSAVNNLKKEWKAKKFLNLIEEIKMLEKNFETVSWKYLSKKNLNRLKNLYR